MIEIAKNRPTILNAVKSHIAGSDLVEAKVLHRDRILAIEFRKTIGAGFYQKKYLILEASGRYSNFLLLDENEKILEAAKHIHADTNRYRSILPGLPYTPPPPFEGIRLEDFDPAEDDALEKLGRISGIGKTLLNALKKACLERPEYRLEILQGLDCFREERAPVPEGVCYFSIGGYVTRYPYAIPGAQEIYACGALEAARVAVISPLLERVTAKEKKKLYELLDRQILINARKIGDAEACLEGGDEADKNLLYGKLILANAWAIPSRASSAELTEWTNEGEFKHNVGLDSEKDAPANAERYFARYRKRKASMAHAKKTLPALCAKRDELQEQLVLLERQNDPTMLGLMAIELEGAKSKALKSGKNSRSVPLPPHARYELKCATLYVGLSAKGNHYVTFRLARPEDIWLHAQKIPGTHVILRFEGDPDEETEAEAFETAAACAAYYSKGRESGHVRVDYAEKKHVRAIPGGGLAHVTYREFGTITADVSIWERFLAGRAATPKGERP